MFSRLKNFYARNLRGRVASMHAFQTRRGPFHRHGGTVGAVEIGAPTDNAVARVRHGEFLKRMEQRRHWHRAG